MPLTATEIAGETPSRALVMLHGIYGRGRNWQGIARSLSAARPDYRYWLVDLPHHGTSGPGRHGETVAGLAADLADWLDSSGIVPAAVLGHSYGGKVALHLARHLADHPLQVWVIDASPGPKPPGGSAWEMLHLLRRIPQRFPTRDAAVEALTAGGFSSGVAQWMATNLVRDGDAFVWRLDFDAMERLLNDFFQDDLWDLVEHPPAAHEIHFLKASESNAIPPEAVRRIAAAPSGRVHLHERPGGHWIHAESPDVVTSLLVEHLPRD